jgi:hypothetical protein
MRIIRKLIEINAPAKLQKIDYLIGAALIAYGLLAQGQHRALWIGLGVLEIVLAYLNVGRIIGEKIARAFTSKRA